MDEFGDGPIEFTYCTTPIKLSSGPSGRLRVRWSNGENAEHDGLELDAETSRQVFSRSGAIECVEVTTPLAAW